jgi:hypothetical protein
MLLTAEYVLSQMQGFSHYMEANLQDVDFDTEGTLDENDDPENPGFALGWEHFLDVINNNVVSFNKEEMRIEVMIGDRTNCILQKEQQIKRFLELQKIRSLEFANLDPKSLRL